MNKYKQLRYEQRYTISVLLKEQRSIRSIASSIGVSPSTISREVRRNKVGGKYQPTYAQSKSEGKKQRFSSPRKLHSKEKDFIVTQLTKEQWSPKQISGICRSHNIDMVSAQTIYSFIADDKAKGGDLYKHLRNRGKRRINRKGKKHLPIKDRVSISLRPCVVEEKTRCGDWEIDLIVGKDNQGAIFTATERSSAYQVAFKLESKNSDEIRKKMIENMKFYKKWIHTVTSDNGGEFAQHKKIAKGLNCDYYFADPYCSWQRGLNEYQNRLIRQYIPKKTDFREVSEEYMQMIVRKLNNRPREKYNWRTPNQIFMDNFVKS